MTVSVDLRHGMIISSASKSCWTTLSEDLICFSENAPEDVGRLNLQLELGALECKEIEMDLATRMVKRKSNQDAGRTESNNNK